MDSHGRGKPARCSMALTRRTLFARLLSALALFQFRRGLRGFFKETERDREWQMYRRGARRIT